MKKIKLTLIIIYTMPFVLVSVMLEHFKFFDQAEKVDEFAIRTCEFLQHKLNYTE